MHYKNKFIGFFFCVSTVISSSVEIYFGLGGEQKIDYELEIGRTVRHLEQYLSNLPELEGKNFQLVDITQRQLLDPKKSLESVGFPVTIVMLPDWEVGSLNDEIVFMFR